MSSATKQVETVGANVECHFVKNRIHRQGRRNPVSTNKFSAVAILETSTLRQQKKQTKPSIRAGGQTSETAHHVRSSSLTQLSAGQQHPLAPKRKCGANVSKLVLYGVIATHSGTLARVLQIREAKYPDRPCTSSFPTVNAGAWKCQYAKGRRTLIVVSLCQEVRETYPEAAA